MSKCERGKPCGASCVKGSFKCRKSLGSSVSKDLAKASSELARKTISPMDQMIAEMVLGEFRLAAGARPSAGGEASFDKILKQMEDRLGGPVVQPKQIQTLEAILRQKGLLPLPRAASLPGELSTASKARASDAKEFDENLKTRRREGDQEFEGWAGSYEYGMNKAGAGSFGSVIRNPDGTYIKRGTISNEEAMLLDILSKNDLGPRMIAADINGKDPKTSLDFVDLRLGRIAMSRVEGVSLIPEDKKVGKTRVPSDEQVSGRNAADIYWEAMGRLHRLGIAHNDAHPMNLFVDKSGKGRWVDMGLSQKSPKAALAEAMGTFSPLKGTNPKVGSGATGNGNWQSKQWNLTAISEAEKAKRGSRDAWREFLERYPVASRVWVNKPRVLFRLLELGLTENDISGIILHGIRSTPESYKQGVWTKLTDDQALEAINILYDGI